MPSLLPDNFQFAAPWYLLILVPVPFLFLLAGRLGPQAAITFSSLHLLEKMSKPVRGKSFGLFFTLFILSLIVGILALARPQLVSVDENHQSNGIEMIIALDVSRSMAIEDFFISREKVTRLTAAKDVTRQFINGRPSDRIGLVAFAGRPYLASPSTLDHEWLLDSLNRIRIGWVEDGTAIGSAIAMSAKRLDKRPAKSKVIVLLTDGSNNGGNLSPIDAARLAKTIGIKVHTIAVGTPGVHPIPMPHGTLIHREEFDVESLQEIARIADGHYFRAQATEELETIFAEIDTLEQSVIKRRTKEDITELFPWFVGIALALAYAALLTTECLPRTLPAT